MRIRLLFKSTSNWSQFTGIFLLIFFTVSGCKKGDADISQKNSLVDKVLPYLESQKVTGANKLKFANQNAKIDLLKENLDFTAARTEQLDNKYDLLILPIKDDVIKKKNLDKNSTLTLLLKMNKFGKIGSGNIALFLPADGKKHHSLPQNTFSNMFSGKAVALDGVYKMLSVTGRWISQLEIKNGKTFAQGIIQKRGVENEGNLANPTYTCYNVFLVTTYYWGDGQITQDEDYIGSYCLCGNTMGTVATVANRNELAIQCSCDNNELVTLCEGGGSGGSDDAQCTNALNELSGSAVNDNQSISTDNDDGVTRTKTYNWVIYRQDFGFWNFVSHEMGVHQKIGNEWQWQSLTHQSINQTGIVIGGNVSCSLSSAVPSVGIYYSAMQINYNITNSVVCKGSPASFSANYTSGKVWNVND